MPPTDIAFRVMEAGVVGAGGAGFPTHIKLGASVETAVANGVECEPLLAHDRAMMVHHPEQVISGLNLLAEAVGAGRKVIAVKKKYTDALQALESVCDDCEILKMPDYYPAGDEVEIVKFLTGRTVPEAGLPLDTGVVLNNVETLVNIARAYDGIPVTHRFITVCGEVENPGVIKAPLGAKISAVVEKCGGAVIDNPVYHLGGPMMGFIAGADTPVTKTTTGIFALPEEHYLVRIRSLRMEHIIRQAESACTSCRLCTDACPRYLLGHNIEPHRVMRTLGFSQDRLHNEYLSALLCCECGVCEYSCPMLLSPRRVYQWIKTGLLEEGTEFPRSSIKLTDHPKRESRRIPGLRLMLRLGLKPYDAQIGYDDGDWTPEEVVLPLKQHIGVPAEPVVSVGDKVIAGEMVAEIPEGERGARIHASIDGTIASVDSEKIVIKAG